MTTQQAPAGLDTLAEAQRMQQDAGVSGEQSAAMLYAAIRVSETHIAEMRTGISAEIKALETGLNGKIEALDTKIEMVSREVKELDTKMSAEIKVLGGKIDALETKIDAVDTKVVAFETSLRESIQAGDTGLRDSIKAGATTVSALDIKIDALDTKSDGQVKITRAYIAVVGLLVGAAAVLAEVDWIDVIGLFR